jgi:succinate dehydrogenase / fumarate reductase cytochrome b subunit
MAESSPTHRARPLSPHTWIWRWHITMVASILHRATGVLLYLGALILAGWALALAEGPAAFDAYAGLLMSLPGLALMFLVTLSAFFHLANGIRHLAWDLGFGFKPATANLSAVIALAFALVATITFWLRLSALGVLPHV